MPSFRFEMGGKAYDFDPARDLSLADWERMELAFGEDFGGWFSFQRHMARGSHKAAKCFIWGARRKAGEHTPDHPAQIDLPADFALGKWWEAIELTPEPGDPGPLESPPAAEGPAISSPAGSGLSAE